MNRVPSAPSCDLDLLLGIPISLTKSGFWVPLHTTNGSWKSRERGCYSLYPRQPGLIQSWLNWDSTYDHIPSAPNCDYRVTSMNTHFTYKEWFLNTISQQQMVAGSLGEEAFTFYIQTTMSVLSWLTWDSTFESYPSALTYDYGFASSNTHFPIKE